jgi:hypothetical protein
METAPKKRRPPKTAPARQIIIGWREWVALPELGGAIVKAKIDTGARTSALHAFGLRVLDRGPGQVASFELHPRQRSRADALRVECPVHSFKQVRSSNGRVERRPVIVSSVRLGALSWPIEVTLTSRDAMGFRMLLGRAAVRRRFLVDPGKSYLLGTPSDAEPT